MKSSASESKPFQSRSKGEIPRRASSRLGSKTSPVGAFPLRSVCVPLINMYKGRVYDVTHCFILGEKVPSSILIKCLVTAFLHIN